MTTNNQKLLAEYLAEHKFTSCVDFVDFYKLFVELEVSSIPELTTSVQSFRTYLSEHIDKIQTEDVVSHFRLTKTIEKSLSILSKKTEAILSPDQRVYVDIVSRLSGNNAKAKILDVGAGKIPISSILLGENHDEVAAMDSYFEISTPTLNKLHVTPISQYFKRTTSVEEFDFVAGNKPCSAIEAIVEACSKANKPYYIELCDCELPHKLDLEDKLRYPALGWETILPEIDNHIKFSGPIAYNIDATPSQLDNLRNEAIISAHGSMLDGARRPLVSLFRTDFTGIEWTKEPPTDELPQTEENTPLDSTSTSDKQNTLLEDLKLELQER